MTKATGVAFTIPAGLPKEVLATDDELPCCCCLTNLPNMQAATRPCICLPNACHTCVQGLRESLCLICRAPVQHWVLTPALRRTKNSCPPPNLSFGLSVSILTPGAFD